jgi:hypothetical protein
MTSKTDGPNKGPNKAGSEAAGPKKPVAILDLKATEVSDDPKAKEQAHGGGKPGPSGASSASAAPTPTAAQPGLEKRAAAAPQPSDTTATDAAKAPTPRPRPSEASAAGPSPAAAARQRSGIAVIATHVAAGVVGGFLALLLADSIGPQLGIGDRQSQRVTALDTRVGLAEKALERRPAVPPEVGQKLTAAEGRLARLEEGGRDIDQLTAAHSKLASELKALEDRVGKSDLAADLAGRIAKLEQTLAMLAAAAAGDPQGGRIPQLAAISGKLGDLETALDTQLAALRKELQQDLETRLGQSAEASEAARSGTQRLDRELAGVKADVARLAQRLEAAKATDDRLEQAVRAVQEEAGSLRSGLDGLKNDLVAQLKSVARPQEVAQAIAPIAGKITEIEQSIRSVLDGEQDRKSNAQRIVLALELGNLKRAVDRGGTYAGELSAVSRIGAGKIDLAALEPFKDQGVPTAAELARSFREVAHEIIEAGEVPAEASTMDRLLRGAKSIVRVRKTEHSSEDTGVEAVVGRMEKALRGGKLGEVLAEAKSLPPRPLSAAEPWLGKVEARAAVDRAMAALEEQLKDSLSGKAPVDKRT